MYGGLDVEDIHDRKGLTARQKILDYMGSTELIANLFTLPQFRSGIVHFLVASKVARYKAFKRACELGKTLL